MSKVLPHYLLFAESQIDDFDEQGNSGFWRFIIQATDDKKSRFEAVDREFNQSEHRLELLAVIRGLEYLDQPSKITLITASRYVRHGFRRGLEQWSANQWQWERFGEMISIKNADLWQRINRALKFHQVDCRYWRVDNKASSESVRRPNFLNRPQVQFEFEPEAPETEPRPRKKTAAKPKAAHTNRTERFLSGLTAKVSPLIKLAGKSE